MSTETQTEKLHSLAKYIRYTYLPLIFTTHLKVTGKMGYGYSMLGLICNAHRDFTQEGRWITTDSDPNVPIYLTKDNDRSDRYLPKQVMEYFGFRTDTCGFDVAELTNKTVKSMYKLKNKTRYSLYEIGLEYAHHRDRAQLITFNILLESPPSLIKTGG